MTPSLPENPSLEVLKKQAKGLLQAQKNRDASCCEALRLLRRFTRKSDEEILAAEVKLMEAQYALARQYGFKSWQDLRAAVAAPHHGRVVPQRQGNRVWLPGIETAKWGGFSDRQNTVIAALTEAAEAMGEEITFDELMGLSGAATRLQVAQPDWCPSAPHATCGFDCSIPAAEALGYSLTWMAPKQDDAAGAEDRRRAIVESIDAGRFALFNGISCEVITGYEDGGNVVLLRRGDSPDEGYCPFEKWTWEGMGILRKRSGKPSGPARARRSLEIAVTLARTERFGSYASGFAAYETWAGQLSDESRYANLTEDDLKSKCFVNGWMYMSLAGDRKMAAIYMQLIASEFEGAPAEHVAKAGRLYHDVAGLLFSERACFPNPYFLYPQDLDGPKGWTERLRKTQAGILRDAMAIEAGAITEMEKALAAME